MSRHGPLANRRRRGCMSSCGIEVAEQADQGVIYINPQMVTVFPDAVAICVPSGIQAMLWIAAFCCTDSSGFWLCVGYQIENLLSLPPTASRRASGDHATVR